MNQLQIDIAASLWRAKMNTLVIARRLGIYEAVVYNHLYLIKAVRLFGEYAR